MRLKSFHVRVFRNVIDSGPIEVLNSTCLVGKNEAGKSALLEALHHLNPAKPIVKLDLLDQYPRWLKKQHEITGEIKDAIPISATLELSGEQLSDLESKFGKNILKSQEIVVTRKYGEKLKLDAPINHDKFVKDFITNKVDTAFRPSIKDIDTASDLLDALNVLSEETSGEEKEPTPTAQAAKQARGALKEVLGSHASLTGAINALLISQIPKTFYFSQYSQLRGRYTLEEVLEAVEKGSDDEEIQAAADFLTLAKISPDNIETWDFEQSNAELEAISSLLSQRVKANWKQNKHLKLAAKIETTTEDDGDEEEVVARYLQFRVEDTRHDFSSRLDRRSTGFRWFVSFIASFFEFETETNLILLLDEPGLSLHARAQKDLLNTIDTELADKRQVIYSTHSPFMVRPESLQHARIVEEKGPETGSVVTNDAGTTSDPDTLFPLQAALGYDIAQNLFIGGKNILVEGVSDLLFLSVLSSHLDTLGLSSLPESARILPAGGATNIATFLALLGTILEVVVLLDGNSQRQRIDNAIAEGRLKESRVFSLNDYCAIKGADIEDIFEPAEYLAIYNASHKQTLKLEALKGKDRIVKRIERAIKSEFNHGRVAAHFLKYQGDIIPTLSDKTLVRFEELIKSLTAALSELN